MHIWRFGEDAVGVRDSWGGDIGCDGVVVEIFVLCHSDFADVRERADVSAGYSLIYGILQDWYAPKI